MEYYKRYLVTRNDDKPIIIKVDQNEKVNRPNNIDDEDWITQYIEESLGGFNELTICDLDDLGYVYLHFDDFTEN
ncbi:hypothetical protein [Clostridium estertheticum]|uniref:Uncharacterized protein n=1 Tax=Clostridium estertheticum subsp. estertheticum TaxID=1552 RepID=A0A1J0GJU4_9CLOT|nr:hypothetical protein [Clostridium estertheticum]APC41551.1 hypothetical protein A7L45_16435 [Clostridium estertheticum subsp. estertheticum]